MKEIVYCNTGKLRNPCVDVVITIGEVIRVRRIRKKITHGEAFKNKYPEACNHEYTQQYSMIAGILNRMISNWGYGDKISSVTVIYKGRCYYNVYTHIRNQFMDMPEALFFSQRNGASFKYRQDRMLVSYLEYDQAREYLVLGITQSVVDVKLEAIQFEVYVNDALISTNKIVVDDEIDTLSMVHPLMKIDQINRGDKYRLILDGAESRYEWHHTLNRLELNLPLIGG